MPTASVRLSTRRSRPTRAAAFALFAGLVAALGLGVVAHRPELRPLPAAAPPPLTCEATHYGVQVGALVADLGQYVPVTVTAYDDTPAAVADAGCTVTLSSATDGLATFSSIAPPGTTNTTNQYTYTGAEAPTGSFTFYVDFGTKGVQTVTATDSASVANTSPGTTVSPVLFNASGSFVQNSSLSGAAVGGTPSSQVLTIQLSGGVTLNTGTPPALASGFSGAGAPNDFTLGSPSCSINGSVQTCTLTATFQPSQPGLRQAPLVITTNETAPNNVYYLGLSGVGTGGALAFTPGVIKDAHTYASTSYQAFGSVDSAGNIYVADLLGHAIYELSANGTETLIAGTGTTTGSTTFPNPSPTSALIYGPEAVKLDAAGNLYIADTSDNVVLKLDRNSNTLSIVAGTYNQGNGNFSGNGGPATSANLALPTDVAIDGAGDVFIADSGNSEVREVLASSGVISDYAGPTGGRCSSDCVPNLTNPQAASGQPLNQPVGLAFDTAYNLYLTDLAGSAVYEISQANTKIALFAGICTSGVSCTPGDSGDGGLATAAAVDGPVGIAVDTAGDVYIADSLANVVRRVDAYTGDIHTIAGGGAPASGIGDNQAATDASLSSPEGVWVNSIGTVYIGDYGNHEIRTIPVSQGEVDDFKATLLGTTTTGQDLLLTNVGNSAFTLSLFTNSDSAEYTATTGDCGDSLNNAGQSCTYSVAFAPQSLGARNATLSGGGATAALNGTGVELTVNPASGYFTSSADNTAGTSQTFTLTNPATNASPSQTIALGNVTVTGTNASAFSSGSDTCSAQNVADSGTCSVTVAYISSATADGTPDSGSLNFADGSTATILPAAVPLTGVVAGTPISITLTNGSPQTTAIGTSFATAFQVQVLDSSSRGVAGDTVTFTAPSTAGVASGWFANTGTNTTTAVTDGTGTATSPIFYANTIVGANYDIAASESEESLSIPTVGTGSLQVSNTALSQAVGGTSATMTLAFPFAATTGISDLQVLTDGAASLDYSQLSDTGSTNCVVDNSYASGTFCTVKVAFTPQAPGLRRGAVVIYTGSTPPYTAAKTTFIGGIGTGPGVSFNAGAPPAAALLSGINKPLGIALDAAGDLFVAESGLKDVQELTAGSSTAVSLGNVGTTPEAMAFDGAGNLYITDIVTGRIYLSKRNDGSYGTLTSVISALSTSPYGIVSDGNGNFYFSESKSSIHAIKTFASGSIATTTVTTTGVTLVTPMGLALDNSGNLYVADPGLTQAGVVKVNLAAGTGSEISTPGIALQTPTGVAVDAGGDLFISDSTAKAVYELPADGSNGFAVTGALTLSSGGPGEVAIDAAGNVYVPDSGNTSGSVYKLDLHDAPSSLNFATTAEGSPSAAQTVTVNNIGNEPLTFSSAFALATTTNFASTGSTCTTSLSAGSICALTAVFSPTVGSGTLTDSFSGTDNTLNASPDVTQTIALSGTAEAGTVTQLVVSAPASVTSGSSFNFTVTAEDSLGDTATSYTGTVTFSSSDGGAITLPANTTLTNGVGSFSATLVTAGSQTLIATDTVASGITGTASITVNASADAATHFDVLIGETSIEGAAASFTVTAQDAGGSTATDYTGTVSFTSTDPGATLPASVTLTNGIGTFSATLVTVGSQTITATDTVTSGITGTSGAVAVAPLSRNVGAASASFPVTFTLGGSTTVTGYAVLNQGAAVSSTDFYAGSASGSPCSDAVTTCTVNVLFNPSVPGLRLGSVQLLNGSTVVQTIYLGGVGLGPVVTLTSNGTLGETAGDGSNVSVNGLAQDGNGVIYFTDSLQLGFGGSSIVWAYTGGKNEITGGFSNATGAAVDGQGNLFVVDQGAKTVYELPASLLASDLTNNFASTISLGSWITLTAPSGGYSNPQGIAVDAAGNLYVADYGNQEIFKLSVSAAGAYTPSVFFNGTAANNGGTAYPPYGLAMDAGGDLFFTTQAAAVYELPAGSSTPTAVVSDSSLGSAAGVALDAAGDLFVTNSSGGSLLELPTHGSLLTVASNLNAPQAVMINVAARTGNGTAGNLSFTGAAAHPLDILNPGAAALSYTTAVNSTSTQTVTVSNAGNAALTFSNFAFTTDSQFNATGTTCATGSPVAAAGSAAAGSCSLALVFAPTAIGSPTDTYTLTDNNLGAAGATQAIALTGTATAGTPAALAFTTEPSTSYTAGATISVAVTVEDSNGNTVTGDTSSVTLTLNGTSLTSGTVTEQTVDGVATFGNLIIDTAGSGYTLTASDTADSATSSVNSSPFAVAPAAAASFTIGVAPAGVEVGQAATATVTAHDSFSNVATNYAGTVHLTSSDPGATLHADATLTNGILAFGGNTLVTVGNQTITATDTTNSSLTITSSAIAVTPVSEAVTTSASFPVTFTFSGSTTLASANAVQVLTQGSTGLDYVDAGTDTCTNGAGPFTSCTVNVTYTAAAPGSRPGAVVVYDSSGVAHTQYLDGIGTGSLLTFAGAAPTTAMTTASGDFQGVAVDAAGDVFGATSTGAVIELTHSETKTTLFTAPSAPNAIAVDGAGNLYVSSTNDPPTYPAYIYVYQRSGTGTYPSTPSQTLTGFGNPFGIYADGAGNLLVADYTNKQVVEISPSGTSTTVISQTSDTSFGRPFGVTEDASGNIYAADGDNLKIWEIPAGTSFPAVSATLVAMNVGNPPLGLAADPYGDLYIAAGSGIYEIPEGSIALDASSLTPLASGGGYPALDAAGNLYYANSDGTDIDELDRQDVPAQSFSAMVNNPADSAVTAANSGNAAATGIGVTFTGDFAASGANTCNGTLDAGLSCTLGIQFNAPSTSGSYSAGVSVASSGYDTPQTGSLSATAIGALDHFTISTSPTSLVAGSTTTATITAYDSAGDVITGFNGTVGLSSTNDSQASFSPSSITTWSNGVGTSTATMKIAGATQNITATDGGVNANTTVDVTAGPLASFAVTAPANVYAGGSFQFAVTALDAYGNTTTTGDTLNFTSSDNPSSLPSDGAALSGSPFTATLNTVGPTESITVTDSSNSSYTGAATIGVWPTSYALGSEAVEQPTTGTVTLVNTTGSPISSPAVSVVTQGQGTPGLDFTDGTFRDPDECGSSLAAGATCLVTVNFQPTVPGLRLGAVELLNGSTVVSTIYVSGVGQAPVATLTTASGAGTLSTLFSSELSDPAAVAADASGNFYVANYSSHTVAKYSTLHGASTAFTGDGSSAFAGVAVDGAGNLFMLDEAGAKLYELPLGGSASVIWTDTAGSANPKGLAVDGAGNVYVSDISAKEIWKLAAGSFTSSVYLASSYSDQPVGMAFDTAGNLYFAASTGGIHEIPVGDGAPMLVAGTSGYTSTSGVALDAAGDVFFTNLGGSVFEIPAGGSTATTLTSAFTDADGLLADGAGNIYVTDFDAGKVSDLNLSALPTPALTFTGSFETASAAQTVTVGNAGNLALDIGTLASAFTTGTNYTSNGTSTTCASAALAAATSSVVAGSCTLSLVFDPTTIGTLNDTYTLTDNNLNASSATQAVGLTGTAAQGTPVITWAAPAAITYGTELSSTQLDATASVAGTTFVYSPTAGTVLDAGADQTLSVTFTPTDTTDYTTAIGSTTITVNPVTLTITANSLAMTYGGTLPLYTGSLSGNITGDTFQETYSTTPTSPSAVGAYTITPEVAATGSTNLANYNIIRVTGTLAITQNQATLPLTPVNPPSPTTQPVTFLNPGPGTWSSLTVSVVTEGSTGLDFTNGGDACTGSTVAADATCSVTVDFSPKAPGLRLGAVELYNNGSLVATIYVSGIGQGAALVFPATATSNLITGMGQPNGNIAVAANGNIYVTDTYSQKIDVSSSGTTTTLGLGSYSPTAPTAIALDGAGNIFFGDGGNLVELAAGAANAAAVKSGFNLVTGIAVDGAGNLYISDAGTSANNGAIYELAAGSLASTTLASGLARPVSVAVDHSGNVYFSDYTAVEVEEILAGGGSPATLANSTNGLSHPQGLALDAAGDVYVVDDGNASLFEIPAGGVATSVPLTPLATGGSLHTPVALGIAPNGSLYVGDFGTGTGSGYLFEFDRSDPPGTSSPAVPALSFSSTYGAASGSQTLAVGNVGNANLTFTSSGVSFDANFPQTAGASACADSGSVAPAAACNLTMDFVPPASGPTTGTLALTDNSYTGATQNIALSGSAAQAALTITASSGSMVYGTAPSTITPTITPNYSAFADSDTAAVLGTVTCTTTATSASQAGSSQTSSCSATGGTNYSITYVSGTVTVTQATDAVNFTTVPTQSYPVSGAITLSATGTSTGTITYAVTSGPATVSGNQLTITGVGAVVVAANQAADTNYLAGTASQTILVTGSSFAFGNQAVDTTSGAQTITLVNTTGAAISTPTVSVVTQGLIGQDFADATNLASHDCGSSLAVGATCAVSVTFSPKAPGLRLGAVELLSGSNIVETIYISGVGTGATITFGSGVANASFQTGFTNPAELSFDDQGNLYIADVGGAAVYKNAASNSVATSLPEPLAAALDGGGNLFIAGNISSQLLELPAGASTPVALGSSGDLSGPTGVAVDGAGNIYVADNGHNRIVEYAAGTFVESTVSITGLEASGFSPYGLAIDASSNLYIADAYASAPAIWKVPTSGGAATAVVSSGLVSPRQVAVDAAGDLYIADEGASQGYIYELAAGASSLTTLAQPGGAFGVAVDPRGNVYWSDTSAGTVGKLDLSDAPGTASPAIPALSFSSTYGTTSSTVNYSVGNVGNLNLTFTVIGYDTNFPNQSSACVIGGSGVAPGANCVFATAFAPPASGTTTGTLALTDNAYTGATQNVALSGSAAQAALTITASSGSMVYGTAPSTITPTITPSYSAFAGSDTVSVLGTVTCTTTATSASTAGSSQTSSCSATGGANYNITYVSGTVTVNQATPTVVFTPSPTAISSATPVPAGALDATASYLGSPVAGSFPSYFATLSGPDTTTSLTAGTTLLAAGSYALSTQFIPSDTTDFITPPVVSASFTVDPTQVTTPVNTPVTMPVIFYFPTAPASAVAQIAVVTQGIQYLDFTDAATNDTCVQSTVAAAGSTCTVNVNFNPKAPGLRLGAVELLDGSGNLLATTYISGIGESAEIAFAAATQIQLGTGLGNTRGVTVDAGGNVYSASTTGVFKIAAGTGTQTTILPNVGYSSLSNLVTRLVIDGAGNLYLADEDNSHIVETTPTGADTVFSCGEECSGVAVDGAGNLYFTQNTPVSQVMEVPVGTTTPVALISSTTLIGGTPLNLPSSLAVDSAGNLFIGDQDNNRVVEWTPAGGLSVAVAATAGLNTPRGVAVDAADDLYVANGPTDDIPNNNVVEIPAGGGTATTLASGFGAVALALDGNGNVYVADGSSGTIRELQQSQGSAPSFTTVAGTPAAAQTLPVNNIGNQPLQFFGTVPTAGTVSLSSASFTATTAASPACTADTPVQAAASCQLVFGFVSNVATTVTESDTVYDNSLLPGTVTLVTAATQTIALTGTATAGPAAAIAATSGAGQSTTVNTAFAAPLVATVTDTNGNLVSGATVTFTAPGAGASGTFADSTTNVTTAVTGSNGQATSAAFTANAVSGGPYNVVASTGSATSANFALTNTATSQTITFPALTAVTYGVGTVNLATSASASSGLAVTYSVVSGPGNVTGTNGTTLNVTGGGPIVIAANQSGNSQYAAATQVEETLTVNPATPTITWTAPAAITYGTALSSTQLDASSGGVAGTFAYTPAAGTLLNAGTSQALSVTFTPTDTADYNSAPGSTTITVNKATPTITWAAPAAITYGTALSSTQLDASSGGVAGSFVYSPAAGTTLSTGASQTLSVTFTPTDTADYTSAPGSTTITVNKATPTISWTAPAAITYGTALSSTQLDASSGGVAGTFVYSPAASTALSAGASQTLSVTFTPTDTADYTSAPGSTTITVNKATPTISWTAPAAITYGTALSSTQLDASSGGVAGTFVYSPAASTALSAGASQTLSVTFTPTDSADYNSAPGSTTITVNKATPTISWTAPAAITYGTALSSTQLDASSGGVAGTFVYSPAAGTTLHAGASQALSVTFTPTDTADYASATGSTTLTVNQATPTISWTAPAAITYGTALSSTQLDASSGGVAGTFVYSPASGTTLSAGASQTLSVTFTPTDSADYNSAPGSTTITVNKATPTITWTAPAAITYGTALSSTQLDASSGGVAGTFVYSPASGTTLSTGASQTLSVTFTPTDSADYNSAPGSTTITVNKATPTITWTAPAAITYGTALSSTQLDASSGGVAGSFVYTPAAGAVLNAGTSQALAVTFTPTNTTDYASATGSTTITVNQATQTITFGPLANQNFGAAPLTLSATASSGLAVTFTVTSGPAAVSGTTLTLTGGGTVTIQASQAGNGDYAAAAPVSQSFAVVTAGTLSLSTTTLNFGDVPVGSVSSAQSVLLSNPSTEPVQIASIAASGDFNAVSNCPTLAAGGSCTVSVTFQPTATGTRNGTLTMTDNAGVSASFRLMTAATSDGSSQTVSLTGVGATAGVQVTPTSLIFGSQVVATTSTSQTVTILNTGADALAVSAISASGDFAATGNCAVVPAGSDCSVSVSFTPTQTGARAGTLTVTDGAGVQTVSLSGTGSVAGAALSPTSLSFPTTVVGTSSAALAATLTNTGTAPLTGITVGVIGDFAQTNTCAATLAAGQSCVFTVAYVPTVAAAETGSLVVTDNLGQQILTLGGTGIAPGVSLNNAQLIFGGELVGTTSTAQSITLTNTGTAPLAIAGVAASSGFTFTTNCSGSIAAGASCTVNISFAPTAAGEQSGTVTVTSSAGASIISTQGQGENPGLAMTPSFAIFGGQVVGTTSLAQTLTVTNTGVVALTLNPIAVSSDFSETDECAGTLSPGASCLVSVSFAPTALGSRAGSITVSDTAGDASALAALSGQGTLPGLSALPSTLAFGSLPVGTTGDAQTVTLTNTGTAPLTIEGISVQGDFAETDDCLTAPIAAGGYCVVNVTMTPTTMGTRTGTVLITDNANGTQTIALSGLGNAAGVSIYPTQLAFGSYPVPVPGALQALDGTLLSVTLTNIGNIPLDLDGYSISGDFSQTNTCGASLAVGARCTLTVAFNPTALGQRTGTLTINDNASGGTQTVALDGFGSPGGLTLSPPVLNFGVQTLGVPSKPQTAVLSNNTGEAINNLVITPSGEYTETNNCGANLADGASCNLYITITPTVLGAITGTVTVSGTLAGSVTPTTAKVRVGLAPADTNTSFSLGVVAMTATVIPPGIGLSIPELSFSATAIGTPSTGQTITLTNTGNALTLENLTITGTNSTEFPFTTTCTATLAPQASCTVTVNFDPDGAGLRTGYMNFTANGGISAQMPEEGIGIGPLLTVSPSSLVYAALPPGATSAPQTLLLENTGGLPLSLTGMSTADSEYTITATTCSLPQTLAVNASCAVSVAFRPNSSGARNSTLTFTSNSTSGPVVVALSGSGTAGGLTLSPLSLSFGAEGVGATSAGQTITLDNTGTAATTISSIAIAPAGNYTETNNCPASLAAGATCSIVVTFAPTATGAQNAALNVTSGTGIQSVALTGAGSDFEITYAGNPPAATTNSSGSNTVYNLGLVSLSGDNQTIALSCQAQTGFSCTVAPTSVTIGAQPGAFTLNLVANGAAAAPAPFSGDDGGLGKGAAELGFLLSLLLLLLAAFYRRRRVGLSLAGAGMLLLFSAACAAPAPPANPSTNTVTVTAVSSTGATHTKTLDLVVE